MKEIERKFLITRMPDLGKREKVSYERYFLFCDEKVEIRIQKKGEKYEFERKRKKNELSAEKQKFEITQEEFRELKQNAIGEIFRDSYEISSSPNITLKVYHGDLEGFYRIEVEFDSVDTAQNFEVPKWFGKEITGALGSRDSGIYNVMFDELEKIL